MTFDARRLLAIGALVLTLAPGAGLAKDPELPSSWRGSEVVVDGGAEEWAGKMAPLAGTAISVGIQNDGAFVYVCLKTSDETAKEQLVAVGLSIYLGGVGQSDKAFGIRFPVGRLGAEQPELPDTGDAKFSRALELSVAGARLEILGRDAGDSSLMQVSAARPIEAAIGEQEGALVMELKVPLSFSVDTPHAVEAKPGDTIAFGLETAQPRRKPQRDAGSPGFRSSGLMPAGPGGRGGAAAQAKRERDVAKVYGKPIKAWYSVPLAAAAPRAAPLASETR